MAHNTNGKPVAEIRVGRITATIWQNTPTDDGVFYSVHITRLFRRGSNWDRTPAFGRDDLLTVAKVADLANTRIYEFAARTRIPQPAGRRRRRLTHETPRRDRSPPRPSLYMRAPAGGTLEDRLPDGPLAPAQAVSVGARLADALAALHEKKCLHGAVKSSIRSSLRVIGVRLQDVAGRGSRDRQPHRAVQLHAVDLAEQLRTCSGVSVGASSSMSDRTPTGQDGTTYTEFYVAGVSH